MSLFVSIGKNIEDAMNDTMNSASENGMAKSADCITESDKDKLPNRNNNHTELSLDKDTATKTAQYDIFISYSRKDYLDEKGQPVADSPVAALIEFLDLNKITYWIDKKGVYSGSEFAEIISKAIISSKAMVFVSSQASNESKWTTREIFVADKYEIPIIPFRIDSTPYNSKFEMMLLPLDYIEYSRGSKTSFTSLLEAIRIEIEHYHRKLEEENGKRKKKEEEQRKKEVLKLIQVKEEEYIRYEKQLELVAKEITQLHLSIGNDHKACPICGSQIPINQKFCIHCGWACTPFDKKLEDPEEEQHLFIARSIWNSVSTQVKKQHEQESIINSVNDNYRILVKEFESYKNEAEESISAKNDQIKEAEKTIKKLQMQSDLLAQEYDNLKNETNDTASRTLEHIERLENYIKSLQTENAFLKHESDLYKARVNSPTNDRGSSPLVSKSENLKSPEQFIELALQSIGEEIKTLSYIQKIFRIEKNEAESLIHNVPCVLPGSFKESEAGKIIQELQEYGTIVSKLETYDDFIDPIQKYVTIKLTSAGTNTLEVAKLIRDNFSLSGLNEAKIYMSEVPTILPGKLPKSQGKAIVKKLEKLGANASIVDFDNT